MNNDKIKITISSIPKSRTTLLDYGKVKAGFTLIELSIVLVIIGLIIGGILTGADLIHEATIRAQIAQIEKYNTAVHTFQTKYNAIPGDMLQTDAKAFGFYYSIGGPLVGDGNGDGILEGWTGWSAPYPVCTGEDVMFWLHLSQAQLIDGMYGAGKDVKIQGATPTGGSAARPVGLTAFPTPTTFGQIFPPAKLENGNYVIVGSPDGRNAFFISGLTGTDSWNTSLTATNNITPTEAYKIDSKIDDGVPTTGNIIALDPASHTYWTWTPLSTPSTNNCVNSGAYYTSNSTYANSPLCSLRIYFQ